MMRKNQVASILPALAANRRTPNVLFMGNNVAGAEEYVRALGKERVLLGFGGVGGIRKDNEIRYMAVMKGDLGRAYAGELDGSFSARLKEIARAFQKTGIPLDVLRNPDAWLKTHAAVILPLACAIYRAGGDNYRLAKDRRTRTLMMHGVRESLRVLQGAGVPITPPAYQMYLKLPMMIQVALVGNLLSSQHAAISVAGHANAARDEMQTLADEFTGLIRKSGVAAPVLNELYGEIPRLP
ncbi:MAG: hypothetical protein M1281_14120 [Chloroflexi bacterium]|nr:hypothetical protein [Chloroflexota bacterium]